MNTGPASQNMGYPPGPPVAPQPPPRGSGRMIVVLLLLSAISAALCVGVIYYLRRGGGGSETAASAASAASAAAPSATAPEPATVRAVVRVPKGQTKAVMRQRAAFDAPVVVLLPAGTPVEVTKTANVKGQTWCRVRTIDFKPAASGWMHADVVQFP